MALTQNEAWYSKAYISVTAESGSEVQLRAKTTSLGVSGGNFDIESIDTFSGKIKKVGTREDFEISFDGIPISHQDFDWIFHGLTTNTATSITSSTVLDYRVTMLWTDETGITAAGQAIATASEAYREMYAECNLVSLEKNMDAGEHLTAAMVFKCPFEDTGGTVNFQKKSCDTTSAMTTSSAYRSANKF